jgi:hypothetical protein
MKNKTVFPLMLILVCSLLLAPLVYAVCVELKYDDSPTAFTWYSRDIGRQMGVRFSIPDKWEAAHLVTASFYIFGNPIGFEVHVYDQNNNDLIQPFTATPTGTGWFNVPLNVMVSGDFNVVIEWIEDNDPDLGADIDTPASGRTIYRDSSSDPWSKDTGNLMIRAVICEPPVGGEILPTNVQTITSWLIAGLSTIAVSVGIIYRKRKTF